MPRSFLVKTHSSPRAPSYRRPETLRDRAESCITCQRLATPLFLLDQAAPPEPCEPVWASISFVTHVSRPDLQEVNQADLQADWAPTPPLKDSQPPLPTRWPPILDSDREQAPGRLLGVEMDPTVPQAFCSSGLARLAKQGPRCFLCRHCDKEYSSLGALKVHIRTHTLPCRCPLCGKAFSRPWLLHGHIRTHTGEKPYACPHCSRAFADRSNLRAHLQTHAGTRKYRCGGCAKTFSRLSLLGRHADSCCCPGP